MFPVRYELGFYIPEDGILHSHRRENLKSFTEISDLKIMEGIHFKPITLIYDDKTVAIKSTRSV
jgi:hypothetical protein